MRRKAKERDLMLFYADVLTAAEAMDLPAALRVEGIDGEIATLRLRLRKLLAERPEDMVLMLQAMSTLARMVTSKYRLPASQDALRDALAGITGMYEDLGMRRPRTKNGHG